MCSVRKYIRIINKRKNEIDNQSKDLNISYTQTHTLSLITIKHHND